MKYFFTCALVFFLFTTCDKADEQDLIMNKVREIAWNYLDENAQASIIVDWQKAIITEDSYQNNKVYAVMFNTKDDGLLGPIVVYVDRKTHKVIGVGLRL